MGKMYRRGVPMGEMYRRDVPTGEMYRRGVPMGEMYRRYSSPTYVNQVIERPQVMSEAETHVLMACKHYKVCMCVYVCVCA
jgi:hypothetical protein